MNIAAVASVLPLVGKGMAGVFLVIAIIWLAVVWMTKAFR